MDDTPIPIEETPEIRMDTPAEPQSQVPPPPPMPKVSSSSAVVTILVFLILFIAGILLSSYIRPFLFGLNKGLTAVPTPIAVPATPTPVDPFANWKTSTIAGLSYKLPPDVLAPVCDGASCASQGTYLPGGTRFTVAPRGPSAFVTDANGVAFINKDATVSGHIATDFFGTFTGRTITGYVFTQMHGFMIEVTPTLTLEINHFTPTGVTTDFAKDDVLFDRILSTLTFSSTL